MEKHITMWRKIGSFPCIPLCFYLPLEYQKTPNLNVYIASAAIAAYRICLDAFSADSLLTAHSSSEVMMQ